ncbi:hypothetical protein LINGRAHAP2_LOCUS1579 [Linum grandiflorum]
MYGFGFSFLFVSFVFVTGSVTFCITRYNLPLGLHVFEPSVSLEL